MPRCMGTQQPPERFFKGDVSGRGLQGFIFAIERKGKIGGRNLFWVEDDELDSKHVKSIYPTNN